MPIHSTDYHNRETPEEIDLSDPFTKIVVPSFLHDVGNRPAQFPRHAFASSANTGLIMIDPATLKPKEIVSPGDRVVIRITIKNVGTIDVTSALLECYYMSRSLHAVRDNINDMSKSTIAFIKSVTNIPARGEKIIEDDWTLPIHFPQERDSFALKVRITDLFSLLHSPTISTNWDPRINPQANFRKFYRKTNSRAMPLGGIPSFPGQLR